MGANPSSASNLIKLMNLLNDSLANIASRVYAAKIATAWSLRCSESRAGSPPRPTAEAMERLAEESFEEAEAFVRVWEKRREKEES